MSDISYKEFWDSTLEHCTQEEKDYILSVLSENKGDLISRQAVINTIANTCFWLSGDDWNELIECINSIPSVENKGEWIIQPSNKEQGERDFIWWKCSKCGQVIYSETEKDRKEFHAFCGRCGADMREPKGEKPKDFPQAEDIAPAIESFKKVLDNKLIREALDEPKGEKGGE